MAKIQMTIILEVEDLLWDLNDDEERDYLFDQVLGGSEGLALHSNEIGDIIGNIISVKDIEFYE